MSEHPSTPQIEHFCLSALPEDELATVAPHVADCQTCHHQFTETLRQQIGSGPISFTLAPEFWFRHDHVDFEQLVGLAEKTLDATSREIIDIHLKVCGTCREDVRSFMAFRTQSARGMEVSYGPTGHASTREGFSGLPWWRSLGWKPTSALAALVLAAVALVIVVSVNKRNSDTLEAKKNEPTQIGVQASPTLTNPANLPSPLTPEPVRSPNAPSSPSAIDTSTAVAVLKDGQGDVTIDKSGHVKGLDEVSLISKQEIAQASLTERIETPDILSSLGGQDSTLRGSSNRGHSFRLLYPARRVLIEDRPVFKWETLAGATSYRVYVLDSKNSEVIKSEELIPAETQWTAKTPLRRGEVFSWVVTAVVDGREVVSPAASAPEMKFALLSIKDVQELNQLKRTRSHLALGVFYARVGLLREAEREFQQLAKLNPQSQLPRKLLRSVRSMRESK
ncbi:MAG: hypothetical protein ACR2H4_20700 [Pyrinomonadaceae bacterium]